MSLYNLHFNKDDVSIRNIVVGLLATLGDNIFWFNQIGNRIDQRVKIEVPFYFSTTGTERYLQDNFLNNIDFDEKMLTAEAFYNQIPRGIVNFSGFSIETQAITNKYVRVEHVKQEDDGTLNTYNSEAFFVPIIMDIEVEIFVDSIIDQLKCSESIIKTFFKNKQFQVDISGIRIPCVAIFPDDINLERTVEFSFSDKKEFKSKFSIQIKSYIPVLKEGTSIFAGNRMNTIENCIFTEPTDSIIHVEGGRSLIEKIIPENLSDSNKTCYKIGYDPDRDENYDNPENSGPFWPIDPSNPFPPNQDI